MARMKFLCDAERCIECNACVTACKNENGVPWGINRRRVVTINDGLSRFGEPTAPWGGVKQSGIGRTHGRIGLREMVQPKYVSLDRSRGPELWWYPYDEAFGRLLSQASPALHARAPWRRLFNLIRLTTHSRLWRRLGLRRLLLNVDKLF